MSKFFENEFIKEILIIMGVPEISFDFANPTAVLFMFIFSTEMFVLILSIVLWGIFSLFKTSDKWGIKEQKDNHNNRGHKTHSYHASNISKVNNMHKMKQERGVVSIIITKFVFPVVVIFIALSVAVNMSGISL